MKLDDAFNPGQPLPDATSATIISRFRAMVAEHSGDVAVVTPERSITYADLAERADALTNALVNRGTTTGDLVGVVQDKGIDLVVSQLAVLSAGAAYVPLAVDLPVARIADVLQAAGARLTLTAGRDLPALDTLDVTTVHPLASGRPQPPYDLRPAAAAYVAHTSGSTGRPKGVVISHHAVLSRVVDIEYTTLSSATVVLQTGAVSFDAATFEIWGPLLNGGRVVFSGDETPTAETVRAGVRDHGVNLIWLTAPLFNEIVDSDPQALDGCEVLVGGDTNSPRHVAAAAAACPSARIRPVYGPTENTTFTTIGPPAGPVPGERVPIGTPIDRSLAVVLDDDEQLVTDGAVGELWVGGEGLATGYLGLPDLTAERFLVMNHLRPGLRLYRTGDLARRDETGQLHHLGRVDQQVKVRGYRVEPAEIEQAMRDYVTDAVVLATTSPAGDTELVGCFIADDQIDPSTLAAALRTRLPDYLVPRRFRQTDAWPLTPHHKVDRVALAGLVAVPLDLTAAPGIEDEPRPSQELAVMRAFRDVLGIDEIHRDTSFFDVGGHSLLAMRLRSRLRNDLAVDLDLKTILDHPTVAGLAEAAASAPRAAPRPTLRRTTI